ncbi:VirD4-like conjugal transfer protein, CD1115 family [Kroppenstedtia eburnea]|uniref:VirD4-like conjugal transfer protein, CD1115 family n=1 Tax=Kroppenstedtia eburnea TaxID=714067 RepID=UPI00363E8A30
MKTIMNMWRAATDLGFWGRVALVFLAAGLFNLFVWGYLAVTLVYFKAFKLEGLEKAAAFVSDPGNAITLFTGGPGIQGDIQTLYLHSTIQGLFWAFVLFFALKTSYRRQPEIEQAEEYGSHGTGRWATESEIHKWYLRDSKGFILGLTEAGKKMIQPIKDKLNQLVIVFGGSGSGKSWSFIIPNVLHLGRIGEESMVITDTKGEIFNFCSSTLRQNGYKVQVLNLLDMKKSARYNPLDFVDSAKEARSLASTIVNNTSNPNRRGGDDFWEKAERNLLTALILYVKEKRPVAEQHLGSVLEMGITLGKEEDELDRLFGELPNTSSAKKAFKIFNQAVDKTRASILLGFGNRLEIWADQEVIDLTAESDIDIRQIGSEGDKTALFLMMPSQDDAFYVLPAIFIQQLMQEMYKRAERTTGNKLSTPVRLFLDELANIAPINNLKKMLATMRGYGISCFLIFQSKSQFEERYGREVAKEIMDSCDTHLLLGSNDLDTKKHFSEVLDSTTIRVEGESKNKNNGGESYGRNVSYTQRRLMTPGEVGRLDTDNLLVLQRSRYPSTPKKAFIPKPEQKKVPQTEWWNEIPDRLTVKVPIFIPELPGNTKKNQPKKEKKGGYLSSLEEGTEVKLGAKFFRN